MHQMVCAFLHPKDVWLSDDDIDLFVIASQIEFMQNPFDCIEHLKRLDLTKYDASVENACNKLWNEINKVRLNESDKIR